MARWTMMVLCLAALAAPAAAEPWTSVFAAETDSTVFLGADGSLFLAPFDLASRQVLWQPSQGRHVARFAVSPAGGRVAWIARAFNDDTTRLWMADAAGAAQRLRYFALRPRRFQQTHSEPDVPTVADLDARGGRLVRGGALMRRPVANVLAWTSDGRDVVVGTDAGVARVPADASAGASVTRVPTLRLEPLRPSPMFLVDAVEAESLADRPPLNDYDLYHLVDSPHEGSLVVKEGRVLGAASRGRTLLSPTADGWRACSIPDIAAARVRAAGEGTLWWAKGKVVYAVRPADCAPVEDLHAADPVLWLGFDAAHGDLLVAAGRALWRRPEKGGEPVTVLETGSVLRAVLPSRTGAGIGLVTRDSLLVWDPATGAVRGFRSAGLDPCALFEGPEGRIVAQVDCGTGLPRRLARADGRTGSLVAIETPNLREGLFQPAARGAWILLYEPGARPPSSLRAYDVRADRWHTVDNPGISAWEPLR